MSLHEHISHTASHHSGALTLPRLPTRRCRIWHSLLGPFFSGFDHGRVEITLPSGGHLVYGKNDRTKPVARIIVHRHRTLWKILSRGPLGLAESFMEADWSCDDLTTLFTLCLKNRTIFEAIRARGVLARWVARLKHLSRANSLKGSKRNISYHYDLGNDFYRLWLDPTMTYSSAYQFDGKGSLEEAQIRKLQRALELTETSVGDHLLEIGCGWGAFAEQAAKSGRHLDGLTLSEEQLDYSIERAKSGGFQEHARFHLQDYRHEEGQYDGIVSIEMIEAVGEENWPVYFQCLHDRLKDGGHAVLQAITIHEDHYDRYRRSADFIQTYIFPGGMLPTIALMEKHAKEAGLELVHQERFRHDYAATLARWREDFLHHWPQIAKLGFDERFKRMWLYYLSYCEAGFEIGTIDVGLYSFKRA